MYDSSKQLPGVVTRDSDENLYDRVAQPMQQPKSLDYNIFNNQSYGKVVPECSTSDAKYSMLKIQSAVKNSSLKEPSKFRNSSSQDRVSLLHKLAR